MIIRDDHKSAFVTISNAPVLDVNLSLAARGLLVYMLAQSDAWQFSINALAKSQGISRGTMIKLVKELEAAGHIEIKSRKNDRGHFEAPEWTIFEKHRSPKNRTTDICTTDTPQSKKPNSRKSELRKNVPITNTNNNKYQDKQILKSNSISRTREKFTPPTLEDVKAYCQERQNNVDPERWFNYYTSNGWKVGRNSMKDWKAAVRTWERSSYDRPSSRPESSSTTEQKKIDAALQIALRRAEGGNV